MHKEVFQKHGRPFRNPACLSVPMIVNHVSSFYRALHPFCCFVGVGQLNPVIMEASERSQRRVIQALEQQESGAKCEEAKICELEMRKKRVSVCLASFVLVFFHGCFSADHACSSFSAALLHILVVASSPA